MLSRVIKSILETRPSETFFVLLQITIIVSYYISHDFNCPQCPATSSLP